MASASGSSSPLKNRREALKSQRRLKVGRSLGRFFLVSGMAIGLGWSLSLPYWTIREASQVEIEGNHLLSEPLIHSLLSLTYPQSIWKLPTHQLDQKLEQSAPIAIAEITRQILPPKLVVNVQERQPVARVWYSSGVGFLDRQGIVIPERFYKQPEKAFSFPTLRVIGYEEQYRPYWLKLYPLISQFSLKIFEIDWRNPSNLVLKTELGKVYMGAYTNQFSEKLKALSRLRQLSSRIPINQIVYIDLTNPESPLVQLKQTPSKKSTKPSLVKAQ